MARKGKSDFLSVNVPKFDSERYLYDNSAALEAINSGEAASAFEHFLEFGIDQNKYSLLRRESPELSGAVERFLVSDSGFCLLLGWLSDEGCEPPQLKLIGSDFSVEFPDEAILRHCRADVEQVVRTGAYDLGFCAFGRTRSRSLLKQNLLLHAVSPTASFQARVAPEFVSDKRLLDLTLDFLANTQIHGGCEFTLDRFLQGISGRSLTGLFKSYVASALMGSHIERFNERQAKYSFVTVLFGSVEPMLTQPVLFLNSGIAIEEWIYVCNSPEDAGAALRIGRLMSSLYDIMITVILPGDNLGFGEANNLAVKHAAGSRIVIINPDVFPIKRYAGLFQQTLDRRGDTDHLLGGLLFYDEQNLMHSGMYFDEDVFIRRNVLNTAAISGAESASCSLIRVEHLDKGVPFQPADWNELHEVDAITGAVMMFERSSFEAIGGFSTNYIYGHYEDADFSVRWRDEIGPVCVDPSIRLVHLEGQGSRLRGDQYRGASLVNRHFFTQAHRGRDNMIARRRGAAPKGQQPPIAAINFNRVSEETTFADRAVQLFKKNSLKI